MNEVSRINGRRRLIDATLTTLGERGYHRSSLRIIAENAGLTAGLVKHHFQGKDTLMLEAYRYFRDNLLQVCLAAAEKEGADPVKRLQTFTRSMFLYNAAQGETMRIWAGFVELVITDPEVAALQATSRAQYIREIRGCVTGIYAARGEQLSPDSAQTIAQGINAIIEGMWFERILDPVGIKPDDALEIALDMIGGRMGVSFPARRGKSA